MDTVKYYKDAGLVFVDGDKNKHGQSLEFLRAGGNTSHDHNEVGEFAWRTNTGVKPDYDGMIEVIFKTCEDIEEGDTRGSVDKYNYWELKDDSDSSFYVIDSWRPLITKEPPPESECPLSPNFVAQSSFSASAYEESCAEFELEDKPIYTQAMCDAGELPSAGMELLFFKDSKLTKKKWTMGTFAGKAYSAGGCAVFLFVDHETKSTHVVELDIQFKPLTPPIKSDEEKLRDAIYYHTRNDKYSDEQNQRFIDDILGDPKFTVTLSEDAQVAITGAAPITLIHGKAYQFDIDDTHDKEMSGIYSKSQDYFAMAHSKVHKNFCTNIKPLTVEGE